MTHRHLHSSWMIAVGCLGVVIGVWLARDSPLGLFQSIAWLSTGAILIVFAVWRRSGVYVVVALGGGVLIGLWRGSYIAADLRTYDVLIGKTVVLSGKVVEDTETNKRGQIVVRLVDVKIEKENLAGSIWLTAKRGAQYDLKRGDTVVARSKLTEGFGTFAATAYSADILQVNEPRPPDAALAVRDWFGTAVQRVLPEPQASLGLGYLVGQRRGLPEELSAALQTAGLMHIVVASGYNLTILVRLARRLFEKISKYLSLMTSIGMVAFFIAITGLSPSMSRAGLVAVLGLFAWYYGRRFHPVVLLLIAMGVTVMWQPWYAWGDLGWQLSFAAFAGVMIVAPLASAYFFGDKKESGLKRIFIETIAAQVCTLPILLVAFGQLSLIAPIANMIIVPFVPFAMLATLFAGVAELFIPGMATVASLPAQAILTCMTEIITFTGDIPWALQTWQITPIAATAIYVSICGACWYMWRQTKFSLRGSSIVE